jgi:hypothetical protein
MKRERICKLLDYLAEVEGAAVQFFCINLTDDDDPTQGDEHTWSEVASMLDNMQPHAEKSWEGFYMRATGTWRGIPVRLTTTIRADEGRGAA